MGGGVGGWVLVFVDAPLCVADWPSLRQAESPKLGLCLREEKLSVEEAVEAARPCRPQSDRGKESLGGSLGGLWFLGVWCGVVSVWEGCGNDLTPRVLLDSFSLVGRTCPAANRNFGLLPIRK